MQPTSLSAKIREEVQRDVELLAQKEAIQAIEARMRDLTGGASGKTSRLKAHKGELAARVDRRRRAAKAAKASRRKNR